MVTIERSRTGSAQTGSAYELYQERLEAYRRARARAEAGRHRANDLRARRGGDGAIDAQQLDALNVAMAAEQEAWAARRELDAVRNGARREREAQLLPERGESAKRQREALERVRDLLDRDANEMERLNEAVFGAVEREDAWRAELDEIAPGDSTPLTLEVRRQDIAIGALPARLRARAQAVAKLLKES